MSHHLWSLLGYTNQASELLNLLLLAGQLFWLDQKQGETEMDVLPPVSHSLLSAQRGGGPGILQGC